MKLTQNEIEVIKSKLQDRAIEQRVDVKLYVAANLKQTIVNVKFGRANKETWGLSDFDPLR
jgi:hypothetical protein